MSQRKVKTRVHFNRVNMQRGKSEVWTAHNSRGCFQAERVKVVHDGKVVMETVFNPDGRQPRAFFSATADVRVERGVVIVEVA